MLKAARIFPAAIIALLALVATLFAQTSSHQEASSQETRNQITSHENPAPPDIRAPLAFEANRGQTAPQVKYLARSREGVVFLTQEGFTVALPRSGSFRMLFDQAASAPVIAGEEPLVARSNYLKRDPSRSITNVQNFAAVRYQQVYPGIDVRFYGQGLHLEHDFLLSPGADVSQIALRLEGIDRATVTSSGAVELKLGKLTLGESAPLAWQTIHGTRRPVKAQWKLLAENRLGISVGDYDHSLPLTIDPVLAYSTHLGGNTEKDLNTGRTEPASTFISSIALDAARNVYVAGSTSAIDFPTTAGVFDRTPNEQKPYRETPVLESGFVSKFDKTGRILIYSTFLRVQVDGMAVDSAGHVYSAEAVSDEFPGSPTFGFDEGINIDKLSLDGSRLLFTNLFTRTTNSSAGCLVFTNSFVGGLAADNLGHVWLTGTTANPCLTTAGAFQTKLPNANETVFVAKFDTTKIPDSSLVYSTYIGGNNSEQSRALTVDSSGNAYVAGLTTSSNFPHGSAFGTDTAHVGFVTKLNATGSGLVFSTLLRGVTGEIAGLALDSSRNVYATGSTSSTGFPTTTAAFDRTVAGDDAFVTKLNSSGNALVYSTFLGGNGGDSASGIRVNSAGMAFVTGSTNSASFPTTANAFRRTLPAGATNAFVTAFQPSGSSLYYSTLLGGSKNTIATAIFVDPAFNAWVAGNTGATDFPVTPDAFQPGRKGATDGFFSKIVIAADLKVTLGSTVASVVRNGNVILTGSVFNLGPDGSDAVVFTEPIPAGYKYQGLHSNATSCTQPAAGATSGTVKCTKTRLESGQHIFVNVFVQAIAASGSNITSKATATARTQDLKPTNNSATVTVHVN